ncbi:aminotransferase class I/II-fold pyridoxal phosphate-dependent enzyme [Rhodococcus fascians]|uniref:aminotransferase class I/II-fold pyridoxal phosphate-dependent enzyme n=1 Tax=Rhodococcoides fascians TaxID=1828 RepID=UPI0024B75A1F|nr:aminotransferase class I/II-fold pyridoxal phosphate-dependent enzyme [Rhodococcus fascians]MDJ0004846.1 aminotransferase class I/II-fold pyridoxal phosphate-dependent enzyme [Rhodococcus fascians]
MSIPDITLCDFVKSTDQWEGLDRMNLITTEVEQKNLTEWELLALDSHLNLSDGHPRQALTTAQSAIIAQLPEIFAQVGRDHPAEVERRAVRQYMTMVRQVSFPSDRVLLCYASSVAMEILARAIAIESNRCALLHPTFDNIPDLLRGNGLELVPVAEDVYETGRIDADILGAVGCVFLTTPNNPTGRVLGERQLANIAAQCREHGVILALDTCFRSFDERAQYDHYRVLEESGCRWVVIEDTGKIWPMHELKVGMLIHSENIGPNLAKIHSDILLAVSPVIMQMVERLAIDAVNGGIDDLHAHIAQNREIVHQELRTVPGISYPFSDNMISVEVVDLGHRYAEQVWNELRARSVYLLPCEAFYWNAPERGAHQLRIALSRDPERVRWAMQVLAEVLTQ